MSGLDSFVDQTGDRCHYCRRRTEDVEPVTVTDDSGGGSARLCASCRAFARSTRCAFCGAVKGEQGKADAVYFGLGKPERNGDPAEICDGCRERLLFSRGEEL